MQLVEKRSSSGATDLEPLLFRGRPAIAVEQTRLLGLVIEAEELTASGTESEHVYRRFERSPSINHQSPPRLVGADDIGVQDALADRGVRGL